MGPVRRATNKRIKALDQPDCALVALAVHLADMLDNPDTSTAAAAKEYRATIELLTAFQPAGETLADLAVTPLKRVG